MSSFLHLSLLVTPYILLRIVISNTKSLLLSDSFSVHVSELYSSMERTSERYTLNFVSWEMSLDAQMVLREAEAPVARPILLLISFSELLSHDKTPPKYVNCSTWPSFVPSMLIWIAGGSREQHWTSVLDVLIFNPNRVLTTWRLSTCDWRPLSLSERRAMSSAKRKLLHRKPEMVAPMSLSSNESAMTLKTYSTNLHKTSRKIVHSEVDQIIRVFRNYSDAILRR